MVNHYFRPATLHVRPGQGRWLGWRTVSNDELTVGVLALQGDVREHLAILAHCGVRAVSVRRERELAAVDGLVIPGGESTTIVKLARHFDLFEPLADRIAG
ncbi:MAG: pyridoxal 5-phosphate synthase pdxT subunit, partial [Pseudonocardiales bacterium]|nr:pyridoxal 5-phosphate synthase pdxT subunit [Pseudonocardiales bacterium]